MAAGWFSIKISRFCIRALAKQWVADIGRVYALDRWFTERCSRGNSVVVFWGRAACK